MGKNKDKFTRQAKPREERAEIDQKNQDKHARREQIKKGREQQEIDARVAQINANVVRQAAELKQAAQATEQTPPTASEVIPEPEASEPTQATEQTPPIASEVMPEPEASEPTQATEQTPPIASEVIPEPEASEPTQATEQTSSETFNTSPRASTVTSDQEEDQIAHVSENDKAIKRAIYNLYEVFQNMPPEVIVHQTEAEAEAEDLFELSEFLDTLIPIAMMTPADQKAAYINYTLKPTAEEMITLQEKTQLFIDMLDRKIKAEPTYSVILKTFYNQLVDAFNTFKKAVYPETHTVTPKWETAHEKYTPTKISMKEALQNIRDAHQENEPSPDSPRPGGRK